MYGYTMNKKAVSNRLRRIEGQVRGIQRMVDEDQYCIDILTQVNSVTAALRAVAMGLLDDHVASVRYFPSALHAGLPSSASS